MKTAIFLASILGFSVSAQAKIFVSSIVSHGESTDDEATQLTSMLQSLGVKSHKNGGSDETKVTGKITITNGAACDNGHYTYNIDLNEIDENGKTVQTISLDGSNGCTQPSSAEKLSTLLDTWGGNTLELDCGAGHCWESIDTIDCQHFEAQKASPAFDSCDVRLSSNE